MLLNNLLNAVTSLSTGQTARNTMQYMLSRFQIRAIQVHLKTPVGAKSKTPGLSSLQRNLVISHVLRKQARTHSAAVHENRINVAATATP